MVVMVVMVVVVMLLFGVATADFRLFYCVYSWDNRLDEGPSNQLYLMLLETISYQRCFSSAQGIETIWRPIAETRPAV